MVAIAHPTTTRRSPSRPVLVVLPPVTRPDARVYRRRRLAVVAAVLSVLALPAALVATAGTAPTDASAPAAVGAPASATYVVQPGDTLWSIAAKVDPAADRREVVDHLVELNGSAALQPGQRLRLPQG